MIATSQKRLPIWLRRQLPASPGPTNEILKRYALNTVCESALCPNRSECYSRNTATFMILGNVCTRRCGFCAIESGRPQEIMADEPERVAEAACEMGLEYVVVTSVARDELDDEGAGHFAKTVSALKNRIAGVHVEVLTPDFHARRELIATVVRSEPIVYNHNLETVERLQKRVRPQAAYKRSLEVLEIIKSLDPKMTTKSGLMLGLGETHEEIYRSAAHLRDSGCDILTLGQYLAPSRDHLGVERFVAPEEFAEIAANLKPLGFRNIFAGPSVRSSYHAGETFSHSVTL